MSNVCVFGRLVEDKTIVYGEYANIIWNDGYYGEKEDGNLVLTPFETLFLVGNGKLKIFINHEKSLSFNELLNNFLKYDPNIWIKYIIYSDLRSRGYIVKKGFNDMSFRVYERGTIIGKDPAKFIVYGVMEGKPISLYELKELVDSAKDIRKDLILAIVDRQNEVAYYNVSEILL